MKFLEKFKPQPKPETKIRPKDNLDRAIENLQTQQNAFKAPQSIPCEKCGVDRQKRYHDNGLFGSTSYTYQECPCGNPDEYHEDYLKGVRKIPEAEYKGTCIVCGDLSPGHYTCQACVDHDEYLADCEFSNPDRCPDISLSWASPYYCGQEWWAGNAAQRAKFLSGLTNTRNILASYNNMFNRGNGLFVSFHTILSRRSQIVKVEKIRRPRTLPVHVAGNDTEAIT